LRRRNAENLEACHGGAFEACIRILEDNAAKDREPPLDEKVRRGVGLAKYRVLSKNSCPKAVGDAGASSIGTTSGWRELVTSPRGYPLNEFRNSIVAIADRKLLTPESLHHSFADRPFLAHLL
jgi:hypothetical protein